MACLHKFHNYLKLELIDFDPTTLIVGTFNPSWPEGNVAQWFYGRTQDEYGNRNNNFWDVLPRLYDENSLIDAGPNEWKEFCRVKRIAITDLIYSIEDADEGNEDHVKWLGTFSDQIIATNFNIHSGVDIVQILQNHPSIENVYFTRGTGETFWRRKWRPIMNYVNLNRLNEARLLTPSTYAFYQQGRWNNRNPDRRIIQLEDFIFFSWQEQWHQIN